MGRGDSSLGLQSQCPQLWQNADTVSTDGKISETFIATVSPQPAPAGLHSPPQIALSGKMGRPSFSHLGSLSDFLLNRHVFSPLKYLLVNFDPFLFRKMYSKGNSGVESKA